MKSLIRDLWVLWKYDKDVRMVIALVSPVLVLVVLITEVYIFFERRKHA